MGEPPGRACVRGFGIRRDGGSSRLDVAATIRGDDCTGAVAGVRRLDQTADR